MTAGLDAPDADLKDFILKVCDNQYHPVLRQFLVDNGIMFDSPLLDDYGSETELACLRQYWPSHAEKWLRAAQRLRAGT